MEGVKTVGQDASFDSSSSCWAWWQGKNSPSEPIAECIDGKTGFAINHEDTSADSKVSEISSQSCMSLILKILQKNDESVDQSLASSSLEEMVLLKCKLSPEYETAKKNLLRHRVFREWSCRCAI